MLLLSPAVLLLLLAGVVLLLDLNPKRTAQKLLGLRPAAIALLERLRGSHRKTLRQRAVQAQGKNKPNFFDRNLADARRILVTTNQQSKIKLLNRLSAACFVVGSLAALAMQNVLMLPVLSVGFALIPMWYIRYNEFYYKKQLCNELEVALSVVTSSYVRTDNLVQSVEENLSYLNEPVRAPFARFVSEIKYVNANVQAGLQGLKASIDNAVFHDWCDILMLCALDRTYKQSLMPVVEQFSDNKALQNSLETIIQMPVRNFNQIIAIALVTIPLIYFVNKDWFFTLVGTWGGKAILTALSAVVFAGMNKAISLSAPIE